MTNVTERRIPASAITSGQRIRVLIKGRHVSLVVTRKIHNSDGVVILANRTVGRNTFTVVKTFNSDYLVTLIADAPPVKKPQRPLRND